MKTEKRRHKLYDHPYLGGLAAFLISFWLITFWGAFPNDMRDMIPMDYSATVTTRILEVLLMNVGNILTIFITFVALLIHKLWFRRDGYMGCFARPGFRKKEVWLFVLCGLALDLVLFLVFAVIVPSDGPKYVLPSIGTVLLSCRAGIFEEAVFRGIPMSIMMKNHPSYKRMWISVAITSIIFGLTHMGNIFAGAGLTAAIVQTVFTASFGLLLGAIYLRTGNILLPMVYHALHDIIGMMDPAQSTGVILQTKYSVLDLSLLVFQCVLFIAAALYLLRKSKWDKIQSTWSTIWAETN